MRNVRAKTRDGLDMIREAAPACQGDLTDIHGVRPYLSVEQLAAMTPWTVNAIRKMVARGVLKLGVDYFQPLGRRRGLVFKWSAIVALIEQQPRVVEELEPEAPRRQRTSAGMDVEQATADLQRLLS